MNKIKEQVVLIHGLGRSASSMNKIKRALTEQGYHILSVGYSSSLKNFELILEQCLSQITPWINTIKPVHFIGHSFGGIIIRGILAKQYNWKIKSCIMLGTPNKGTRVASYISSHWLLKYFCPKITAQLSPQSNLINQLLEPEITTGIIAGTKSFHLLLPITWFYKKATNNKPGDGVVELFNTRCSNMSDFIALPLHHSLMMWNSVLIKHIVHFLQTKKFIPYNE